MSTHGSARTQLHRPSQAYLAFSLQADLRSVFSWNTKLLFVYLVAEYATPLNQLNQAR
jgi:signal peptidase complex subunit 3